MAGQNGTAEKIYDEGSAVHSAQGRAHNAWGEGGGVATMELSPLGMMFPLSGVEIPPWNTLSRDIFLRKAYRTSSLFSIVVFGESSRVKNTDYTIESENDNPDELAYYQDMFRRCDLGKGFSVFRSKLATDILTQDNGGWVELISNSDPLPEDDSRYTERPLPNGYCDSFAYMDSAQCYRTYDPEYPMLYTDPFNGKRRLYHYSRVFSIAQFPQGDELGRGKGLCALSRAYEHGRITIQANTYTFEKITGQSPDIYVLNVPFNVGKDAIATDLLKQEAAGFNVFRNPIVMSPKGGGMGAQELKMTVMSMKQQPDGFDRAKEFELGFIMIAGAFGVDPREYFPGSTVGQTASDAMIQAGKAEAKGIKDVMNSITEAINRYILPEGFMFKFDTSNPQTQKQEAEAKQMRVNTRMTQVQSGELSVDEARQQAAKEGDIDSAFLEVMNVTDEDSEVKAQATRNLLANFEMDVRQAALGNMSRQQFVGRVRQDLMEAVNRAYVEGLQAGGYNLGSGLTDLMRNDLKELVRVNRDYGVDLVSFVFADPPPTAEQIANRMSMWQTKTIGQAFNKGLLRSQGGQRLKWSYGETVHCMTCFVLDGVVLTADDWQELDVEPQGDMLDCGGFRCQCRLDKTEEPSRLLGDIRRLLDGISKD